MLFPSTASIGSERFVIVGVYIKIGFLQGFAGGRERKGCVLSMGAQSCWCYNRWISAL